MKPSQEIDMTSIAGRIREYVRTHKGTSLRKLSLRAGVSPTLVQKVVSRAETDAGDVGLDTLAKIAGAMGVSLVWLIYGDELPDYVLLRALPGWAEAAREAIDRLGADPKIVEAIGGWHLHDAPERVDAILVASLVRVWKAGI